MKIPISFILALISLNIMAQKQIKHQRLQWSQIRFITSIDSASKWKYDLNVQDRRYIFPNRRHQLFIKNSVSYSPNKFWNTTLGLLYFEITQPQNPFEQDYSLQMPEIRPTFSIANKSFFSKFKYTQRVMAEYRFIRKFDTNFNLIDEWRHFLRLRWRNALSTKITNFKAGTSLTIFNEIMFNFGKEITYNAFDQNRIGFTFKQKWNKKLSTIAGFFNWYQQTGAGDVYFSRYISRFGVIYKL